MKKIPMQSKLEKTKKELLQEIDVLHSGLMAVEELLVEKGIVTLEELNLKIGKAKSECEQARKDGRKIYKN